MAFLTGVEIRRRIDLGDIEIRSLDSNEQFHMDSQVTEDSIDLRLAPAALRLRPGVERLDYLHDNLDLAYEEMQIPAEGYDLLPLQPLITHTLEAVCFPDDLIGLVVTRSTFARMGIIVNCMAPKFAIGIRWAFPLQLVNLSGVPVRVYPYAPVAQLLISEVTGVRVGYRGKFQDTYSPIPPRISDRERRTLSNLNPDSVNRTFHIIKRDAASRNDGEPRASRSRQEPAPLGEKRKIARRVAVAVLGVLSALGFGVCGNVLAGGSMSYWQGVSVFLLFVLSSAASSAAYVAQAYWSKRDQIFE
ncbi:dCTP deaminase [Sinosporangium siamense]|uniref:Deoxycytidine triphosphate deaminase n=1 Tax=Sinosporangium siamense TaxID=1367973 RepID=A0A919RDV3_9ACTN|nr:hypothetical protein [Sinosporangium siamense]GII90965.1 hypothetical protein Ssi02_11960 [Sinosporangium siamense]